MSIERTLTLRSEVLSDIIQLKKGQRSLCQAILHRFKRSFEKFKFGDLSAWQEMEGFNLELRQLNEKFMTVRKNIQTTLPFDVAQLKKHAISERAQHTYKVHSVLDSTFIECLETLDEVFALLEIALVKTNIPHLASLKTHKQALKQTLVQTLILYVYQPRKPSFYMGNYCQSSLKVRKAMLKRVDMTFESFSQWVMANALELLSDNSKQKLLNCSHY